MPPFRVRSQEQPQAPAMRSSTLSEKLYDLYQGFLQSFPPAEIARTLAPQNDLMPLTSVLPTGEAAEFAEQQLVGPVRRTIKAYHGSPHDFDQFSLSKIGTGEGAQAYGHGLYFAEKEGTAKAYRDALSPMEVTVRGVPGVTWERLAPGMRGVAKGSLDVAKASGKFTPEELDAMSFMSDSDLDTTIRSMREQGAMDWRGADAKRLWNRRADVLEKLKAETEIKPTGKTYEVNIHASSDELLDWDKPLSQQPPKVQEASRKLLGNIQPVKLHDGWYSVTRVAPDGSGTVLSSQIKESTPDAAMKNFDDWIMQGRGENFYRMLGEESRGPHQSSGPAVAAEKLKGAGIKGIQYLDQGSRSAGEGTKNFVIFDDKIIEIAKKYGLSLPVAASLYKWQQSQSQQKGVE